MTTHRLQLLKKYLPEMLYFIVLGYYRGCIVLDSELISLYLVIHKVMFQD